MCLSITGFSNLFTNESNDRNFVYYPSNSRANWLRMIMNLVNRAVASGGAGQPNFPPDPLEGQKILLAASLLRKLF